MLIMPPGPETLAVAARQLVSWLLLLGWVRKAANFWQLSAEHRINPSKVNSILPKWHINSRACQPQYKQHTHTCAFAFAKIENMTYSGHTSYCNRQLCHRMQRRLSLIFVMIATATRQPPTNNNSICLPALPQPRNANANAKGQPQHNSVSVMHFS